MLVTARAEYACVAMMELAVRYGNQSPTRLADITDKHEIPQRFLVQILLQMKAAGLVTTTRGKSGGYHLARQPDQITLADIIGVLDHLEQPVDAPESSSAFAGRLRTVWQSLAKARMKVLEGIRLADLIAGPESSDYSI